MYSLMLGAFPHQLGFLTKECCSAPRSLGMNGPLTTVGLISSGFAAASNQDLPCQTWTGTGPNELTVLSASRRESASLSVTVMVMPSAVNESMRGTTVP